MNLQNQTHKSALNILQFLSYVVGIYQISYDR